MKSQRNITRATILLVILSCATLVIFPSSRADPVSQLFVQTSANVLRAGSNNTITMQVQGIAKLLSNLDVSLDLQQPLVLFGDNHWRRNSFGPGDSILVALMIFAPSSTAGNSYLATLTATYKEAGETTYSQETHTIGFLVRGWIDIVIYDISVDPSPAGPGSTVTISGSLLNRGVTAAMFTNITIRPEPLLFVSSDSVSYMGQVDPNAPAPFSVSAEIEPSTPDGRYDATLIVYYQDDLHMNQQVATRVQFDVSSSVTQTLTTVGPSGLVGSILAYAEYLVGLLILIVIIFFVVRVRRGRRHDTTTQAFYAFPCQVRTARYRRTFIATLHRNFVANSRLSIFMRSLEP